MEIRNICYFFLILVILSCRSSKEDNFKEQAEKMVSRKVDNVPLKEFRGDNLVERIAIAKVKGYLLSIRESIDDFFVCYILYPHSIINHYPEIDSSFSVAVDLTHRISINYGDSIERVNAQLAEDHKGEEWIPIIPPSTGNVSGKDRSIYYYFDEDSISVFLSQ